MRWPSSFQRIGPAKAAVSPASTWSQAKWRAGCECAPAGCARARVSARTRGVSASAATDSSSSALRTPRFGFGVLEPGALAPTSGAAGAGAERPLVSSAGSGSGSGSSGQPSGQQHERPADLALRRLAAEADEHARSPGDSRRVRTFSSGMYVLSCSSVRKFMGVLIVS